VEQILVLNSQSVDFSGMANMHSKGHVENLKHFKKGVSGNPGGRPKARDPEEIIEKAVRKANVAIIEDLREAAKLLTAEALETVRAALNAPDCPWPTRVTAAFGVFDRGWGKAKEHVQADVKLDLEVLLRRGRELHEQRERERERLLIEGTKTA
jgi:hypothetical protein